MRDSTVTIGGHRWRIKFVAASRLPKDEDGEICDGWCVWDKKQILVCKGMDLADTMETILHEVAHASNPLLYEAEGYVTALARSQREALERTRVI